MKNSHPLSNSTWFSGHEINVIASPSGYVGDEEFSATNTILQNHKTIIDDYVALGFSYSALASLLAGAGENLPVMLEALQAKEFKIEVILDDGILSPRAIANILSHSAGKLAPAIDILAEKQFDFEKLIRQRVLNGDDLGHLFYGQGARLDKALAAFNTHKDSLYDMFDRQSEFFTKEQVLGIIYGPKTDLGERLQYLIENRQKLSELLDQGAFNKKNLAAIFSHIGAHLSEAVDVLMARYDDLVDFKNTVGFDAADISSILHRNGHQMNKAIDELIVRQIPLKNYIDNDVFSPIGLANILYKAHDKGYADALDMLDGKYNQIVGYVKKIPLQQNDLEHVLNGCGPDLMKRLEALAKNAETIQAIARAGKIYQLKQALHEKPSREFQAIIDNIAGVETVYPLVPSAISGAGGAGDRVDSRYRE